MIVALTVTCALACAALIVAEARRHQAARIAAKLVASAAFVAIGVAALHPDAATLVPFVRWIVVGLVFGALGDAALLGHGSRWFMAGLVAFLIGHLAYVIAAAQQLPPTVWLDAAGWLAIVPMIAGAVVTATLWSRLGTMRVPVLAYVVTIVAMVIAAIAVARAHALPAPQHLRFVIGAILFFASDIAVARDRFVGRAFVNRAWGLPTYYAGQLVIAWSIVDL